MSRDMKHLCRWWSLPPAFFGHGAKQEEQNK